MTAQEMELSMERTRITNKWASRIPTHFIVWSDWSFVKVNELDTVVWATQNTDANWNWIHIEIVGNFNETKPNEAQYVMVKQIIKQIQAKYPKIEIKAHRDFQPHTCPWKNFDMNKLVIKTNVDSEWYMEFTATRYYSPVQWQDHYYKNKTYEADVCMNCGCWWDCTIPANWIKLKKEQAGLVVACPKEYKLGTKFEIKWYWVVTCVDRGSAIVDNKLDIWVGYGDTGLNVIETKKRPAGDILVKIVK